MVRDSGGIELAKSEETAAGVGSPFPCGSILPQSQAPPGPGRGGWEMGWLFWGQGRLGPILLGPGFGPQPSGGAGPGEQVS